MSERETEGLIAQAVPWGQAQPLLPCPFCGQRVSIRKGVNAYGHCKTEGCYANRAQIIPLDDAKQVDAWNRRLEAPAPTCQQCGGEIAGWLCQKCPAEFRENDDGVLIFDAREAPAPEVVRAWMFRESPSERWHVTMDRRDVDEYLKAFSTAEFYPLAIATPEEAPESQECDDCGSPLNSDGECIRDLAEREADDRAEAAFREEATEVPADVQRLVAAARVVAFEDQGPAAIKALDIASEAFASRVPWDDEPEATREEAPAEAGREAIGKLIVAFMDERNGGDHRHRSMKAADAVLSALRAQTQAREEAPARVKAADLKEAFDLWTATTRAEDQTAWSAFYAGSHLPRRDQPTARAWGWDYKICTGCSASLSIEEIAASGKVSCCPDRRMVTVRELVDAYEARTTTKAPLSPPPPPPSRG